jgi:hypothetical protein
VSVAPSYQSKALLRDVAYELLTDLAACLCVTLEDWGLPPTCFCGVLPGQSVALDYFGGCEDDSCGNGMAWVRLAALYPAMVVGVPNQTPGNCDTTLGIDFEIGVVRCISAGLDDGEPVPVEELAASTYLQTQDALAMRAAMACCSPLTSKDYVLGAYTPYGPEGLVVGGTWTAVVVI